MKALRKSSLREIRISLGRYLAILAIVALGVGFFCGLRVCRDAMIQTGDDYLDRQSLYDYRLISTLGFDKGDEEAIASVQGVTAAEGSVSQDAIVEVSDTEVSGVIKFHSLTENVNAVSLTAGRLPRSEGELVADAKFFTLEDIGRTVRLSDLNDEDTLEMFTCREYTIVGLCNSPIYLNYERGSTSLGDGSVLAFAYILPEGFDCDYFTEIFVRLDAEGEIYSDEYTSGVEQYEDVMTDSGESEARERFATIIGDARSELYDGAAEYDEGYAEYLQERDDAERELLDAWDEIVAGAVEIEVNEQKLLEGEEQLRSARSQYASGLEEIESSERQLESAEASTYAELDQTQADLEAQRATMEEAMAQIEASGVLEQYEQLEQSLSTIDAGLSQAQSERDALIQAGEELRAGIAAAQSSADALSEQKQQALDELSAQEQALLAQIAQLEAELAALAPGDDERIAELNALLEQLAAQKQSLEAERAQAQTDHDALVAEATQTRDDLSTQLEQKKQAVSALEAERDAAIAPLRESAAAAQAQIDQKNAEIAGLDPAADAERIAQLQGEVSQLQGEISQIEGEISTTQQTYAADISALQGEADALSGQLAQAQAALEAREAERGQALGALDAQLGAVDGDISAAQQELSTLTPSPDAQKRAELLEQLRERNTELEAVRQSATDAAAQYDAQISAAQQEKQALEEQLAQYEAAYEANLSAIDAQIAYLNQQREPVAAGIAAIDETGAVAQYRQMETAMVQVDDGLAQVEAGRAQADAEFASARAQIRDGRAQLADAREEIAAAEQEITDGRAEIEDARQELSDGRAEYEDGRAQADREFAQAERELADARGELADAREKIDEIEEPEVYVLDRTANVGYVCFESDTQIVKSISNVFPLFFFMVAALVCMTTMTRMVDEQRTQIGVLKAMGYTPRAIMGKFVFYAGSAAVLGSVIGFFAGSTVFPKIVWMGYDIMYGFSEIELVYDWGMGALAMAVAIVCAVGATWASVRRELRLSPAQLLRPAAPKAGKRIFLERMGVFWRRLSFMKKLTARNIFRYKKRLVMMIIGIGGCTALLVTGLGIRDSVSNVVNYQFDEITLYDIAVNFVDAQDPASQASFRADAGEGAQCLFVHESTVDASFGDTTKSVYLVATDAQSMNGFVDLHMDGESVALPGEGEAVISIGLSQSLGVGVGDALIVRDSDMRQTSLTVVGVFENYVYNYVFARPESFAADWGYEPEIKSAYVCVADGEDPREASARLSGLEGVASTSVNLDMRDRVNSMMENLDYIIVMVVFCAGALAFIVLYNLTNINITERTREIATVKVLGFYPRETASYVFSENMVLCVISALVGLPAGKLLHAFVMAQIKIDMMYFDVRISALSYALAIALTFVFAMFVNFALRPKLEKINMAESLKTVE